MNHISNVSPQRMKPKQWFPNSLVSKCLNIYETGGEIEKCYLLLCNGHTIKVIVISVVLWRKVQEKLYPRGEIMNLSHCTRKLLLKNTNREWAQVNSVQYLFYSQNIIPLTSAVSHSSIKTTTELGKLKDQFFYSLTSYGPKQCRQLITII